MTGIENGWTREIEKLRKDKAALLTAAKELLMNLYVDGTVANFNARTAKLRAAIARAESGEISTGIFRPRVTRRYKVELSIDSTNKIRIDVHGILNPKSVLIHDVDTRGRTAAREIVIGNITITMFGCDPAPEDGTDTSRPNPIE